MLLFRLGGLVLLCLGLSLVGCSASSTAGRVPVYKVTGKITMNGAAVANANVFYSPKGTQPVAIGRTGADGQYTLATYDRDDGAAEGNYVVLVTKEAPSTEAGPPTGHDAAKGFDAAEMHAAQRKAAADGGARGLLPEKYSRADKSDLSAVVKPDGPNEINLDLKP